MLRLNLCSGQRPFGEGWTNVDAQERWKPDVVADCSSMPMFADGSAELIVIHHGLEHFGCGEADAMLKECYRILQPGGSLLVFVPDMLALACAMQEGTITDQIYFTNVYGAYMGDEADRHKWGFTRSSLAATLKRHGFLPKSLGWRDWGQRIDHLLRNADVARDWWILGMEGIK